MSKKDKLIHLMKTCYVSPHLALSLIGCYRFSARIYEIRKVYDVKERWVQQADGTRYKTFYIGK